MTGPDFPQVVDDAAGALFQVRVFSAQDDVEGCSTMPVLWLDCAVKDRLTCRGALAWLRWNFT